MIVTDDLGAGVELSEVVFDGLLNVDVGGCEDVAGRLAYRVGGCWLPFWMAVKSDCLVTL